ncbi:MAG: citrate transporter [Rhodobacteraceae bacterium GWE1_64_9]|nr:MAG: citrate transporter [Rhodobacteraceae bacterium GWE1_64_9]OHC50386.1 MAG: citrate transporter [Rhodobacteraceae bacterium GWF1_65_7]HBD90128.1 SLC13 family permease [Gemmobacter sp.]
MTMGQISILAILALTVAAFLYGRWRHDVVALGALVATVLAGLVPTAEAFDGFGHPAVITVACVLVLSRALQVTGAVDVLARRVIPPGGGPATVLAVLCGLGAFLSSFMNNVGALALLMPLALQLAPRVGLTPGRLLMPLAFTTVLGGTVTLIGTPPNLIIAGLRERTGAEPFGMFDFTPVGLAVTVVGVAFIALVGWRLVPIRNGTGTDSFDAGAYMTELLVPEGAKAIGQTLADVEARLQDIGGQIVALERRGIYIPAPRQTRAIESGDILVIEGEVGALMDTAMPLGLKLAARAPDVVDAVARPTEELLLREYVVRPDSPVAGATAADLELRSRHGINLLAVSRGGQRAAVRLRAWRIRSGDVLLLQGGAEALAGFVQDARLVALAPRDLRLPDPAKALTATLVMAAAVLGAASGFVAPELAFACGLLATMVLRTLPLRDIYDSIDWPVIVLLAAMMPVAAAMETTGAAALIADVLMQSMARGHPVIALILLMAVTMTLSDVMNNAATAAVMGPIALGSAAALGVNPDAYLMAVALGASCSFLTPIGHQNNTLILGPGGFRFGDYWRLGLPLELIALVVGVPAILWAFPLQP